MFGRRFVAGVVASGIAIASMTAGAGAAEAAPSTIVSASEANAAIATIVEQTNVQRVASGLKPLAVAGDVAQTATQYSKTIAATGNFSHDDIRYLLSGERNTAGENLFSGYGKDAAGRAVAAWMNSPAHRDNILNPNFSEIGVGLTRDAKGQLIVVQRFVG